MDGAKERELRDIMERLREKARRKVPEADAEDLVQETLVVLVERMRTCHVEAVQAYAEGILRHVIYDYYQHKKDRQVSLENHTDIETKTASPEQQVVWMRHLRVIDGLAEENRVDKALVNEHFIGGSPLREVATQLKVSPGVVNGRLFRFRQKLEQRVGSCFAILAALFVGLWSRVTRAWMVVRVYGAVAGMFSIGTMASWMWWKKTPTLHTPFQVHIPKAPKHFAYTPQIASFTTPTLQQLQYIPTTQEDSPFRELDEYQTPTFFPSHFAPIVAPMGSNKTAQRSTAQHTSLAQKTLGFSQKTWALPLPALLRTAAGTTPTYNRSTAQTFARAGAATTVTPSSSATAPLGSSSPNQANTPSAPASTGTTPSQTNPHSTPGTTPSNPATPPKGTVPPTPSAPPGKAMGPSIKVDPTLGASKGITSSAMRPVDDGNRTIQQLPTTPASKRSFCVVQDGRIYSCGNGQMSDITGTPDSTFGCGMNKLCTDMIGAGPSLLFTQGGGLFILGDHIYRSSTDGGKTWMSSNKTETPDALLNQAAFILNQNGTLWQRNQQSKWTQARSQRTDVHEIRIHLAQGKLQFEDDTGFALGVSWQTTQERQIQKVPANVQGQQAPQTAPNLKPDLQKTQPQDTPISGSAEKMIPTSAIP